nr:MAG TPA: hypothetical protein [Bacteriophage sp.]
MFRSGINLTACKLLTSELCVVIYDDFLYRFG